MMSLFITAGCDFVSYFKTVGKAFIFNAFFQKQQLNIDSSLTGSLHQIHPHNRALGFNCFIRMIGLVYFSKHLASFNALNGHKTPLHLYNSIDITLNPQKRHKEWIESITRVVSDHIKNEEERVPSYTALWRHWLWSCWTGCLWLSASTCDPYSSVPHPKESGWLLSTNNTYKIDWEDPDILCKI